MKTRLLLALVLFSFYSHSQNTKISGKITNPVNDKVYLSYYDSDWKNIVVDSCALSNGEFSMNVQVDSIHNYTLVDEEHVTLHLAPGDDLHIEINTLFFDETIVYSGKGARRNQAMTNYYLCNEFTSSEIRKLGDTYVSEADTTRIFAGAIKLYEKQLALVNDYEKMYPELKKFIPGMKEDCSEENAKFQAYMGMEGKKFAIMAKKELGKPFDELKGLNLKGNEMALSDLYGKPMVLDFWATWCGPCIGEVPAMQKLEEEYKDKVLFVSICAWSKEDKWKKMAKKFGFEHNIFLSEEAANAVAKRYMISGIPRYIFLDEQGNIVSLSMSRPSYQMNEALDDYLSNN
jgi:thiol-disulfide isomerase/thioredoxin